MSSDAIVSRRLALSSWSEQAPLGAIAAFVALAAAWPTFAFSGSQIAYAAALAAAGMVAVDLVRRRSRLLLAFLALIVGLIGTEPNGTLGSGRPILGSLRLLDFVMACALLTLVVGAVAARGLRRPSAWSGGRVAAGWAVRWLHEHPALAVCAGLLGYGAALWVANGAPVDGLLKTDVRLMLLAVGTYVLVLACRSGPWTQLPVAFCLLGALCFAKAFAIKQSGLWTIGSNDRLQAGLVDGPPLRVILLGGDTILILVPAIAVLTASFLASRSLRALLGACAAAAGAGLLLSGTRTSLLVAGGLVAAVVAVRVLTERGAAKRGLVIAVAIGAVAMVAGVVVSGVGARLIASDPEHVGLNFRKDELRFIFELPAQDVLAGQGLAGRFVGKDVNGQWVVTGWSHALPAWILLKFGVVGLLAVGFLLGRLAWLAVVAMKRGRGPKEAALGITIATGILVLSLTLNRAALPEGAVLLTMATGLVSESMRSDA